MLYKTLTLVLASQAAGLRSLSEHEEAASSGATCRELKAAYQESACCGNNLQTQTEYNLVAPPPPIKSGVNSCEGQKPHDGMVAGDGYFNNINCTAFDGILNVLEQAGANVTEGYEGEIDAVGGGRQPITQPFWQAGLCAVNVHWHLGTEHLSVGEYDEYGVEPTHIRQAHHRDYRKKRRDRRLSSDDEEVREGFLCHHYDASDPKFTTEYDWKYCPSMQVGMTYEIHWPHSAAGACGTPDQFQSPFYDGVFCRDGIISLSPLNTMSTIGVQAQVFTIVNDESYYYPDLMRGMIIDGEYGQDIAKYTGSTTGTSRDNTICSRYTPITWQVDRKCHLISASSFDKMCGEMLQQRDDFTGDTHAHGARALVADHLAANNLQRRHARK